MTPEILILDVDGVFTDGKFYYTVDGKFMKVFGPDDASALEVLKKFLKVTVISADKKGFDITKRRIVEDMNLDLNLVGEMERLDWIKQRFNLMDTIYMGDGIFDSLIFQNVGYSIAPENASAHTKSQASFVTEARGGERAVAEACIHILGKFFNYSVIDSLGLLADQARNKK